MFKVIKNFCKYWKLGVVDGCVDETCRHPCNIPPGNSWGDCKIEVCPILKDQ